jgi:DNA adenine methylase
MSTAPSNQMTLGAILPYFGGKRNLADRIVAEFGPHKSYWELCCGSLAVLFAKPRSAYEHVVDLNGDVTNLTRVLASDQYEELEDRVRRTMFSEGIHQEAVSKLATGTADELDRAYYTLVVAWMGRNGTYGLANGSSGNFCPRYTHNGGNSGTRWQGVGRNIPPWHDRLFGVGVLTRDVMVVAKKIGDAPGTVIYADPPYLSKSHEYAVDFAPEQHRKFADLLRAKQHCRIIVSYYDAPELDELYPGWTKIQLDAVKVMTQKKGGAEYAPEVLLINGPSLSPRDAA